MDFLLSLRGLASEASKRVGDEVSPSSSAWAQIRATLLNFEQPCSNWGIMDLFSLGVTITTGSRGGNNFEGASKLENKP